MATYPSKSEHHDHVHLLDGLAKTHKISGFLFIDLFQLLQDIPETGEYACRPTKEVQKH